MKWFELYVKVNRDIGVVLGYVFYDNKGYIKVTDVDMWLGIFYRGFWSSIKYMVTC